MTESTGYMTQCSATPAVAPASTDTVIGVDSGRDSYRSASDIVETSSLSLPPSFLF